MKFSVIFLLGIFFYFEISQAAIVFLQYHRFGEDEKYPSTSVSLEQFHQHTKELEDGYKIMDVSEAMEIFDSRDPKKLPDKAVVITIDDAYKSFYRNAFPKLKEKGWPFILFVNTLAPDQKRKSSMSWEELEEVASYPGATIGCHTVSHSHMIGQAYGEKFEEVFNCITRIEEKLGIVPKYFAYPYGEAGVEERRFVGNFSNYIISTFAGRFFTVASKLQKSELRNGNFEIEAAFGQHSGVYTSSVSHPTPIFSPYNIPRFSLNLQYGNIKRFKQVVKALAFSVFEPLYYEGKDRHDKTVFSSSEEFPKKISIQVEAELADKLNCFLGGERLEQIPSKEDLSLNQTVRGSFSEHYEAKRVSFASPKNPLPQRRNRLNCTAPSKEKGRYYWAGIQFVNTSYKED